MSNNNDSYRPHTGKAITPAGADCNLIEEVTGAYRQITTDHGLIHQGKAFSIQNKFTLAAAAIGYLELIIPAGAYVHFKPVSMQSDGPKILIQLIEAPTITTGNSPLVPVNRRRVGTPAVSIVTVKNNPTAVSAGTVLDQDYIGGGTGAGGSTVSGGVAQNDNEWVLKPATTYVVKVTNSGSGSADVNIKTFWYEETAG